MNNGASFYNVSTLIAAIGLLPTVAAAFLAYRALFPERREVVEGLKSKSSLLIPGAAGAIEVRYNNAALSNPYVVEYYLSSHGRYDVKSENFDQDRPIIVEFEKQIVADLTPPSPDNVQYVVDEGKLKVGPDLLKRRKPYVFTLLFNGDPGLPEMTHHLSDTHVTDERTRSSRRYRRFTMCSYLVALALCVAGLSSYSQAYPTAGLILLISAFVPVISGVIFSARGAHLI